VRVSAPTTLSLVEASVSDHFGHTPTRASVSFVGVEPIEILRYEPIPGEVAYVSLGMSRRPMTSAAELVTDATGPRAELMLHLRADVAGAAEAWRSLAVLAAAPVVEGVVYAVGMTVDLGQPFAEGSRCTGVVLTESRVEAVTVGDVEPRASDVEILQVVPATSEELAWGRVHGSAALRELWQEQACDLLDLGRRGATLPAVGS
jgi:hypothetical protein